MKKLRLDLDTLVVESFGTRKAQAERGTVQGNSRTYGCGTWEQGCSAWESCAYTYCSCDGSC
jgi:hypothetical protein